ncbi:DUF3842 domain-containing protein, partial [Dysosmobacter welbionis]
GLPLRQRPGEAVRRHQGHRGAHAVFHLDPLDCLAQRGPQLGGIGGKTVVIQGRVVRPVVAVLESHRHQPLAVSLHTAHQRPACRHGIAGLQADTPLYLVQQLVVVGHGPPANGDAAGGGHPYQSLIFHRRAGKTRHVPGRGVMVLM